MTLAQNPNNHKDEIGKEGRQIRLFWVLDNLNTFTGNTLVRRSYQRHSTSRVSFRYFTEVSEIVELGNERVGRVPRDLCGVEPQDRTDERYGLYEEECNRSVGEVREGVVS